jgi:hypothetical protein
VKDKNLHKIIEDHVPGLPLIVSIFAIIELVILLVCMAYSGNQDIVKIYNSENEVVYEDGYSINYITEFKNISGIKNFKEEGFVVKRLGIENSFPTRAWIALSICIPLIIVLFIVFIVKVFADIFHSREEEGNEKSLHNSDFEETKFEKLFSTLGRLNIYSLGCTVILIVFLYWMVPDLLIYLGKISYQTISELKWIILCLVIFGGLYMILKTFLSHKTKTEIIIQQSMIQQNRDKLAIEAKLDKKLLEDKSN